MATNNEWIKLENANMIISNIGNELTKNQNLLKLIKYDRPDALSQPNLTPQDIRNLVGKGVDRNLKRIFQYPWSNKTKDDVRSEIRFFIPSFNIEGKNIYLSELKVNFQVVVHDSLIELDNNLIRPLCMINEILKVMNGFDCGGVGLLQLKSPINIVLWSDDFSGYTWNMNVRSV